MKLKKKYLSSVIAVGLAALVAGNALADAPSSGNRSDVYGDRLINLPMDESTVTNKSVDVYYLHIPGAYGYTVDLVGSGAAAQAAGCDGSDRVLEKSYHIMADPMACSTATTALNPGDGNGFGGIFAPSLHLCKHTLADLPDGNYAIAINPLVIGKQPAGLLGNYAESFQEQRRAGNCGPNDDDGHPANPEGSGIGGYFSNALRDGAAPNADFDDDSNYQLFAVADASPAPTVAPSMPDLELPLWDNPYNGSFVFEDDSGATGAASWYQLWITDANGNRVLGYDQNPVGKGWFNVAADTGEIACVWNSAQGKRICTVIMQNTQASLTDLFNLGHSPNDKWNWWVRGWNAEAGMGPWSKKGQFIGN